MKTWKLVLAVALAAVAVLLMTSIVIAAPASKGSVQVNRVYDDLVLSATLPMTHPVGIVIAVYFNIPYTQVMELHDEGLGFGEIARAYLTAMASDGALTPEQVLAMRQDGVGWGQIKKDSGVHPGGNGLGSIKRNKPEPTSTPGVQPGNNGTGGCPGNSCNAPGQQKPPKDTPPKPPKN